MKLRITQKNFETYTGQMGVIYFEDGVSTKDVLPKDARRMAAVMHCEWEDGSTANVAQLYLDEVNTGAPMHGEPDMVPKDQQAHVVTDQTEFLNGVDLVPSASQSAITHTEDELAAVADEKGIAGLREIADPLGIKGNSIRGLIDSILQANPAAPKAE